MFDPNNNSSQGRSGGGFGSRLVIAIIIALVAWFMYATHTEVNPVTGEKQHVSYSPDQEVQLGLRSAPEMARQMGESFRPQTLELKKSKKSETMLFRKPV